MEYNFGFKVCRICLRPDLKIILNPLFEADGKLAEMFRVITGVEPSKDINKHEILICDKCTVALKRAYELRCDAETAELHYFEHERKTFESKQLNKIKRTTLDTEATARIGKGTTEQQADDQTIAEQVLYAISDSDSSQEMITDASENNEHVYRESRTTSSSLNHSERTLLKNTSKQTKRFKCAFKNCGKSFTSTRLLTYHQKIHFNLRPFKCYCGKTYSIKSHFKAHIIAVHGDKEPTRPIRCRIEGCGNFHKRKVKTTSKSRQLDHQKSLIQTTI